MAIIGILLAIAVPRFLSYIKRGKSAEAQSQLTAIEMANIREFHENTTFVVGTIGDTPSVRCCAQNFAGQRKCAVVSGDWTTPSPWTELGFSIDKPFYFQYAYTATAGNAYTATATGDLDCDGDTATYTLHGYLSANTPASTFDKPANSD